MCSHIKKKKYFQRNVTTATGNSSDTAFVPGLARAMPDTERTVRGYAARMLGRIGGLRARQTLEASLSEETDRFARAEIQAALEAIV